MNRRARQPASRHVQADAVAERWHRQSLNRGAPTTSPVSLVLRLVFIMIGALVVPLSVPLIIVMLTAMFSVHLQNGFSTVKLQAVSSSCAEFGAPGYEMNLLYIAGLLTLAWSGPGPASVDRWRKERLRRIE